MSKKPLITIESSLRFNLECEKQRSTDLLDEVRELKGKLAKKDASLASCEKDAERYRWLRDEAQYSDEVSPVCVSNGNTYGHAQEILAEEELDEAIDAAITKSKEARK